MKKIGVAAGLALLVGFGFVPAGFCQGQADITLAVTPELNCPNGKFDSTGGACKEAPLNEFASDITMPITPELNCANGKFDSTAGVCKDQPLKAYSEAILMAMTPALGCPGKFDVNTGLCK